MTRNSRHQEYACQIVTSSAQDAVISAFSSAAPLKPRRLCISGDWRKPVNVHVERNRIGHIYRLR